MDSKMELIVLNSIIYTDKFVVKVYMKRALKIEISL